jgi:hypothetical protein
VSLLEFEATVHVVRAEGTNNIVDGCHRSPAPNGSDDSCGDMGSWSWWGRMSMRAEGSGIPLH